MVSFIGCQFDSDVGDELYVISVCSWILLAVWTLAGTLSRGFDRFVVLRFEKEFGIGRADGGDLVSSGPGWAYYLATHDFSSDSVDRLRGDREANGKEKRLFLIWKIPRDEAVILLLSPLAPRKCASLTHFCGAKGDKVFAPRE